MTFIVHGPAVGHAVVPAVGHAVGQVFNRFLGLYSTSVI